jgi:hypothetical protein
MAVKRARAREARGMMAVNKEGNGYGNKEGNGNGNNTGNGYGDEGGGKKTAATMVMATAKTWAMAIATRLRATKRAMARVARVMATATRVAGN